MKKSNLSQQIFCVTDANGNISFKDYFSTYYEFNSLIKSGGFIGMVVSYTINLKDDYYYSLCEELRRFARIYLNAFKYNNSVRLEFSSRIYDFRFKVLFVKRNEQ